MRYNKDNILIILKPKSVDKMRLLNFIEKNLLWIEDTYKRRMANLYSEQDNSHVSLWGKTYNLKYQKSDNLAVIIGDDDVTVFCPQEELVRKTWNNYQYEIAKSIFYEEMQKALVVMKDDLSVNPFLVIGSYKSIWGLCNKNKNTIKLNIALLHYHSKYLEYVIYHELCHFIHFNHSPEFHQLLQKYLPNERKLKKEMAKFRTNI